MSEIYEIAFICLSILINSSFGGLIDPNEVLPWKSCLDHVERKVPTDFFCRTSDSHVSANTSHCIEDKSCNLLATGFVTDTGKDAKLLFTVYAKLNESAKADKHHAFVMSLLDTTTSSEMRMTAVVSDIGRELKITCSTKNATSVPCPKHRTASDLIVKIYENDPHEWWSYEFYVPTVMQSENETNNFLIKPLEDMVLFHVMVIEKTKQPVDANQRDNVAASLDIQPSDLFGRIAATKKLLAEQSKIAAMSTTRAPSSAHNVLMHSNMSFWIAFVSFAAILSRSASQFY